MDETARLAVMELTFTPHAPQLAKFKEQIYAADLIPALQHYANHIKVLSLDCFDTLLWRKTSAPIDVFYDVQHRPAFRALGFTATMRIQGESKARILKIIQHGHSEVTLTDIYHTCFPQLNETHTAALIEAELAAEIAACYAFQPMVELIRAAHQCGLKIIIVSDTYFTQPQLRQLLSSALPSDVMAMIDTIFCSSEHGKSKARGLLQTVLTQLDQPPENILHLGDNQSADFAAARNANIHALHFLHHSEHISELLRMQLTAASFLDPTIRHTRALHSPFHGVLATAKLTEKPEQLLGYAAIGPIMYAFANYIAHEITALKQAGKNVKVLFLMRDAYLPSLVCEALTHPVAGHRVRISRFAAYAASFRTQADVDRYLIEVAKSNRLHDIARQLLLPEEVIAPLVDVALHASEPTYEFTQLIHRDDILRIIFEKSTAYRKRLFHYLEKQVGLKRGDTLVFVDLGYSGTAQRQLEPLLRDEMNIEVIGRYLISLSTPGWEISRRGLLDPASCDERTMLTLINYIALLEQICTTNEKSVIDYDQQGNPIYSDAVLSTQQYNKLEYIQAECLRFAKDANHFFAATPTTLTTPMLHDAALAGLSRLLFLPTETEIHYLQSFEFDLNLGTKDVFRVFDQEAGLQSLRRRGVFFSFMEKHGKSMRTNYPAELRAAGLELVLSLMAHHRYSLELGIKDLSLRHEWLNIIAAQNNQMMQSTVKATATHDGYFSIAVPAGRGDFHLGFLFGQKYQWVQLESVELIKMRNFLGRLESDNTLDAWSYLSFNQMTDKGDKLFECLSEASLIMASPPPQPTDENYVLRVVFRPIVRRAAKTQTT